MKDEKGDLRVLPIRKFLMTFMLGLIKFLPFSIAKFLSKTAIFSAKLTYSSIFLPKNVISSSFEYFLLKRVYPFKWGKCNVAHIIWEKNPIYIIYIYISETKVMIVYDSFFWKMIFVVYYCFLLSQSINHKAWLYIGRWRLSKCYFLPNSFQIFQYPFPAKNNMFAN